MIWRESGEPAELDEVLELVRTAPPEEPTAPAVGAAIARLFAEQPAIVHWAGGKSV